MGYIADATIAAFRGRFNLGYFFRLDTDPVLHLWWGPHDIKAQMPGSVDDGSTVYIGGGLMTDVPDAIEVLINGAAERADWTMSGVPADLTAQLADAAPAVAGKRADFAVAALDDKWQIAGGLVPLWVGTADFWAMEQPAQTDVAKPKQRRLTLSTMTGDSSRSLPFYSTWTDRDQQNFSPSDKFCDRVSRYYPGQIIRWPRF